MRGIEEAGEVQLENASLRSPEVLLAVDGASAWGRGLVRGVLRYANAHRRWLVHEDLHAIAGCVRQWPACDGAIVATTDRRMLEQIASRVRHVVVCSEDVPCPAPVRVCVDGEMLGKHAAEHLIGCGLKHFAFCEMPGVESSRRGVAFQEELARHGFACERRPAAAAGNFAATAQWVEALTRPVGIFAWDDAVARELAVACQREGIGVPEEVAILGVNNDELLCESAWPPLSSIDVDYVTVGMLAAERLEALMQVSRESGAGGLQAGSEGIQVPSRGVVLRQSSNLLAVEDPYLNEALVYIRAHACDPCTVTDLLVRVPLTRRSLERRFSEKLGRTPHDEITRVRLAEAMRLLEDADDPLTQVAEECGFLAVQSFSAFFRKHKGISPAAYRRQHRQGKESYTEEQDNEEQRHTAVAND